MNTTKTLFSIIVPTYNRPEKLAQCLQSFVELEYPRDKFQVIVVNDSTEISVENTISPFQNGLNLTLLTQPNSGPATARNTGAFAAEGKFLVFTDDDCTVAADWLQNLEKRFVETPDCLIGGRTVNALPDNIYSTASQQLIDYLYSYYNAIGDRAQFFTSNNFALPAEAFEKIGGFDTTFSLAAGEDREFCFRWLNLGGRAVYAPEVTVYHSHALTLRKFWRQQFNYGRGAFLFGEIISKSGAKGKRQHPSFYLNLLTYPFSQGSGIQKLLIAALFLVSQAGIAAGLFWEKNVFVEKEFVDRGRQF
ncbi:MAG: glycosyltransferase [Oscillatoriales cyanobacterium]|uniref:glycosyltransferase n=1 Tax=unclassified Microcoleus TaxID=2642155 RepID=UPI001E0EFAFA|nr:MULTISPECIES: glycosyltransferase [unclassified Microcoleus]TAF93528.1 MAG: glycosyltransferase [Oscillatoriales cyanobacterium]MCC3435220.1 glycosyltransferase [Microcoleus sp. PH2017_05_CCC_O_A]MCC3493469.1 glycosyltransferase [Microcoleus sp. PH2017_16_JOR_D_A]TAG18300.1 MAG: glycosyltransferase [Oscillatoriales cyanobacterium]TAG41087.1 MAG: glycosyltransferase [Oscillatoriales cyanobacterium]